MAENVINSTLKSLFVKKIYQIDNHTFALVFGDDMTRHYRLSDLQKSCPCANCMDEKASQSLTNLVKDDVTAMSISSVGRYALRIQFSSGCSRGIFGFDFLRKAGVLV